MTNFNKSLQIGKVAETAVKAHLEEMGYTVIDVSDDKAYQAIDIDFIVKSPTGETLTLEVKHDSKIKNTGNLFLEWSFDRYTGTYQGWAQKSKADNICFYDAEIDRGLIMRFKDFKKTAMNKGRLIEWFNNTDQCYGTAYILPLEKAQAAQLITHKWGY